MRGFVRAGENYVAQLSAGEQLALTNIVSMSIHILAQRAADVAFAVSDPPTEDYYPPMAHTDLPEPESPVLLRLFPQAVPGAEELSREFRRLTEPEIRKIKGRGLLTFAQVMLEAQAAQTSEADDEVPFEVVVTPEQAMEVARALTDVRLVLADKLGIESAEDSARIISYATGESDVEDRPVASENDFWSVVYVMAGFLQETLMDEMLAGLEC